MRLRFITRMDSGSHRGWSVRILLPNGFTHSKLFTDGVYEGKGRALKKAITYRNKMVKKYHLEYKMKYSHNHNMTGPRDRFNPSKTGVIGVIRVARVRPNITHYSWKGYWWDRKTKSIKQKTFAVIRHGECGAFQWACKARYEACGPLRVYKDRAKHNTPCGIPRGVKYKRINDA